MDGINNELMLWIRRFNGSSKSVVGCRVGVGMLWGGGIPFIENEKLPKCQSFQASKLQRVKAQKCHSCKVYSSKGSKVPFSMFSGYQIFGVSKFHLFKFPRSTKFISCFLVDTVSCYHNSISCFDRYWTDLRDAPAPSFPTFPSYRFQKL